MQRSWVFWPISERLNSQVSKTVKEKLSMTFVKMVTLPLPSQNPFCLSFIRTLEIAFGPARIISGFLTESHLNLFCQRRCHLQVSRVRTLNLWYLLFSLPHKLVKKSKGTQKPIMKRRTHRTPLELEIITGNSLEHIFQDFPHYLY